MDIASEGEKWSQCKKCLKNCILSIGQQATPLVAQRSQIVCKLKKITLFLTYYPSKQFPKKIMVSVSVSSIPCDWQVAVMSSSSQSDPIRIEIERYRCVSFPALFQTSGSKTEEDGDAHNAKLKALKMAINKLMGDFTSIKVQYIINLA